MNQNPDDEHETEELDETTEPAPESGTKPRPEGNDPASAGDVPEGAQYGGQEPNPER